MRVYVDSMVWVYFLEGNAKYGPDATTLMLRIRAGNHTLLSSFMVLGELLVLPKRNGDRFSEAAYKRLFNSPDITLINYPPPSVDLYANLRAQHRTGSIDTLHAALAAAGNSDVFITEDTKLLPLTIPGIGKVASIQAATALL
jgi:predicted nucleic acid-binding protein